MDLSIISTTYGLLMQIDKNNPTWHIAGIGALGSLIAGSFCHAGHAVNLLLKHENQLTTYRQSTLTVIDDTKTFTCHPPATVIDRLGNEPIHYLICCVKAYEITKLLMHLNNHLSEQSIIILVHNGMGVLAEIKAQLPRLRIVTGISTIGGYLEEPFTVRAFLDGKFHFGSAIGAFSPNEIKTICTLFQKAALPYQWENNINHFMWEKFSLNCSVNILTALFNCKNGDLLTHVESLKMMTQEVAQVIRAYGVALSANDLYLKVTHLLHRVANNYSSMYKDVKNNRPTELRYLNEHLIELAQRKNIATPFNKQLLNQFYTRTETAC